MKNPECWYIVWTVEPEHKHWFWTDAPMQKCGVGRYNLRSEAQTAAKKWLDAHPEVTWSYEVIHRYGDLP